ncbi:MAG: hypothetical protein ACNJA3_12420 [Pseudomonas rhizophila]|uniref:hypothetical protein n=1 Tax=Pseudomonas rhizophila TaxID=2045200 RepID=UPI003F6C5056
MHKSKGINKTNMFQGLEQELVAANYSGTGIEAYLREAEKEISVFFENPSQAKLALRAGGLTFEHAFIKADGEKKFVVGILERLLSEFREARDIDANKFISLWGEQSLIVDNAIKNVAGIVKLMGGENNLEEPYLVKYLFRLLGDYLEGSLQAFCRLRLAVWALLHRRRIGATPVVSMSYGKVLEELSCETSEGIYFSPEPKLSLSQWRNIAQHNSYRVVEGGAKCSYGNSDNIKEVDVSIAELKRVVNYVNDLYYAHKIAYEFFNIDNMNDVSHIWEGRELPEYDRDCAFAYSIVAMGFSIVHVEHFPNKWKLTLMDINGRGKKKSKSALQSACIPYIMFVKPFELEATVRSGMNSYKYSFMVSTANASS